jgi:hypothetical protein
MSLLTGNQLEMRAAKEISADRTTGQYWGLPDISADRKPSSNVGRKRDFC